MRRHRVAVCGVGHGANVWDSTRNLFLAADASSGRSAACPATSSSRIYFARFAHVAPPPVCCVACARSPSNPVHPAAAVPQRFPVSVVNEALAELDAERAREGADDVDDES